MADQLERAFIAVEKYAKSIGEKFIEVRISQANNYYGEKQSREFDCYVPGCSWQRGPTIEEVILKMKAEREINPPPVKPAATEDIDLPF